MRMPQRIPWRALAMAGAAVGGALALARCTIVREEEAKAAFDECGWCHTSPLAPANEPFHLYGTPEANPIHAAHRDPSVTVPIDCVFCHELPEVGKKWVPPHLNQQPDVFVEGNHWIAAYDRPSGTCNSYCHGTQSMSVFVSEATQQSCVTCHLGEPKHDTTDPTKCAPCHDASMHADGSFKDKSLHIVNSQIDVGAKLCMACHGEPPEGHKERVGYEPAALAMLEHCGSCHPVPASPFRTGSDDPHNDGKQSLREDRCQQCHDFPSTDGAHDMHVQPSMTQPIDCNTCHTMPSEEEMLSAEWFFTHLNQGKWPVMVLSGMAVMTQPGAEKPSYDAASRRCSNVYCHFGKETPAWDHPPPQGLDCDGCHGHPPQTLTIAGGTHPQINACDMCHPDPLKDVSTHINGLPIDAKF